MRGMKRFGEKKPRKKPATANDIAIRISKGFLKQQAEQRFFSGKETYFTPELKQSFNVSFQLLMKKNNKVHRATWGLVINYVTEFSEDVFRYKSNHGEISWTDVLVMLRNFNWESVEQ